MIALDCGRNTDIKLCLLEHQLHCFSCWRNSEWVSILIEVILLFRIYLLIFPFWLVRTDLLVLYLFASLSPPSVPDFSIFGEVMGDAFALAIVGYAISISLGKTFALKHGYKVDSNQVSQNSQNKFHMNCANTINLQPFSYFVLLPLYFCNCVPALPRSWWRWASVMQLEASFSATPFAPLCLEVSSKRRLEEKHKCVNNRSHTITKTTF